LVPIGPVLSEKIISFRQSETRVAHDNCFFLDQDKTRNKLRPLKLMSLAKLFEEFINKGTSMHMNLQQISYATPNN
jgi:hypothetical protein